MTLDEDEAALGDFEGGMEDGSVVVDAGLEYGDDFDGPEGFESAFFPLALFKLFLLH